MLDSKISPEGRNGAIERFAKKYKGRQPVHVGCTIDEELIKEISRSNPDFEWSISTGPANWFVIDADVDREGPVNIQRLFDEHSGIPLNCFVVNTQSGGQHLVFKNNLGLGAHTGELGPMGCDIRANGSQIVCPGTIMSSGKSYTVDDRFASFEAAFGNGNSLPDIPDFIAALIGKTTQYSSLNDQSPEIKVLIQQLEENDWPDFDDAFDPVLGHDLKDVAYRFPEFTKLYENPTGDHSTDRFNMAKILALGSKNMSILDYAAFCGEWDGAGEHSTERGRGYYSSRDLAREFAPALKLARERGPLVDGHAFGAVRLDRIRLNINMSDPGEMNRPGIAGGCLV